MLNREAQEIHTAKLRFDVCSDFQRLQHVVQECDYFTTQYYINNTCLDLTVMDAMGVRQTLPRHKDRQGARTFKVVREYRFVKALEQHSKDFFDEIAPGDGPVLMALKELVENQKVFRFKGFTSQYDAGVRVGHILLATFEIDESEIMEYKTVDSPGLGITVSRSRREIMPANPVYAAVNSGSYYNPFKSFVGPEYSMFRIFANYHEQIKEKYWYNIGEIPIEVEYTCKPELAEGIHIQTYTKQEETETATNNTIKIVKFEEVSNKNGFFTSQRDAMLGSNTLRSDREKEQELKEREQALKEQSQRLAAEVAASDEKLVRAKQELNKLKQETDELSHRRQIQLLDIQHSHAIELEGNKRRVTDAEHRLVSGKLELSTLQMDRDVQTFHHDLSIEEKKRSTEVLKIQGSALKHVQDLELATVKHGITLRELDRAETLATAQLTQKLTLIEADLIHSTSSNKRRLVEENTKLVSSVAGSLTTIGKLLF